MSHHRHLVPSATPPIPALAAEPEMAPNLSLPKQRRWAKGLRLLATGLALSATPLWAEPFAMDRTPVFTVSESYTETIASLTEDGSTDYWVEPSRAESRLIVAAKLSSTGIDFSSIDEQTPISFSMGEFSFEGTLGEARNWRPGLTSAVFPLTTIDEDTDEEMTVGTVTVGWTGGYVTYAINVADPASHPMLAPQFAGEEHEATATELTASVAFGDFSLEDRSVYFTVDSSVLTRTVGRGDDAQEFDLASVRLRGAIDTVKPQVSYESPADEVVTSDSTDLSGLASDNIGLDHVNVRVNDREVEEVDVDDGHWNLTAVVLRPGANTIQVQAVDLDGNESDWLSRSVRYLTPLTVTKTGEGTLSSGFLGTSLRVPGAMFTVKAVPAPGYVFRDWSGDVGSQSSTLTFTMEEGTAFQANFIPSPFPAVRGSYAGLITGGGPVGAITYNLLPSGGFSAKLKLDHRQYSFSGTMDAEGVFHGSIPRPGGSALLVDLAVDVGRTGALTGTIMDGDRMSEIRAERSMFNARGAVAVAGKYTLLLPAGEDESLPGGDGCATIRIDGKGAALLAGTLGDGTAFTATASVTQSGTLMVQAAPYSGRGMLQGQLLFADVPGISDLEGALHWIKPPTAGGFYRSGFETTLEAVGSVYVPPAVGKSLRSVAAAASNALITLGGGGLRADITKTATLRAGTRVMITNPGADRLAVKINSATGFLSGRFLDPATGAPRVLKGAVLQKQNLASGVFRGVNQAGYFNLTGK